MFDMKALGENIRRVRKVKGLTQEELAEKADLSTMSIRRYEKGERIITESVMDAIAKALDVESYIFFPAYEPDNQYFSWWWPFPPHDVVPVFSGNLEQMDPFEALATAKENNYTFSLEEREIVKSISFLNTEGKQEAVKRIRELTEIRRYRDETTLESKPYLYEDIITLSTLDGSESTPASQEGEDAAPPSDTPETPPEGE